MQGPEKNSYNEFDNEKKFLRLENSPPPPNNFSNGPSLSYYYYCEQSMCMTVCTSKCWTLLVLWFVRDGIRVFFKNNFPAHNLHVKMLDFAPFTIRTWKNLNCLRYLFAQTIFTNNLLFEHLK